MSKKDDSFLKNIFCLSKKNKKISEILKEYQKYNSGEDIIKHIDFNVHLLNLEEEVIIPEDFENLISDKKTLFFITDDEIIEESLKINEVFLSNEEDEAALNLIFTNGKTLFNYSFNSIQKKYLFIDLIGTPHFDNYDEAKNYLRVKLERDKLFIEHKLNELNK